MRQTAPAAATVSAGQDPEEPEQVSAVSQPPFAARQTVPLGLRPLGQVVEEPEQVVVVSHDPVDVWQVTPPLPALCTQLPELHKSVVHTFVSGSQEEPFARFVEPVHVCGFVDVLTVLPVWHALPSSHF